MSNSNVKNQEELIPIVDAVLTKGGLINSHLDSFNNFTDAGLFQIMTQVFEMKYEMDATGSIEHDTSIQKYTIDIVIDNVNIEHPTTYNYDKQESQIVMPNEALLKDLTYCSPVYINATILANAYHEDGRVSHKKEVIKNYLMAKMPIMVGSKLCNTYNKSKETLIRLQEDPSDQGGYFIIKGNQYIINNLESMKYNEPREFLNIGYKNEMGRSELISKPGDAFENSFSLIIKLLNNNCIVINISKAGFKEVDIPFYMIFRAFGLLTNKKIIEYIAYSLDNSDPITKQILNIIEEALTNRYTDFDKTTADNSNIVVNQTEVLEILAKHIPQYDTYKVKDIKKKADGTYKKEDLNTKKFVINKLQQILDTRFLPHIGLTPDARIKKAAYLGHMIYRLLLVHLGVLEETDRDSYKNKRIYNSGVSYSRSFKTQFNFMFVQKLKKQIMNKDFKNNSFNDVNLQSLFKNAIKPEEFEKALMNAITSGDKTITVNKLTFTNHLSSQQLHHKNKLNVLTSLKSIDTPNKNNSSKSSERAILIRQVHPTGTGYICGITSADTGVKVGMSKQLAVAADITGASSSEVLKHIVFDDEQLIPLDECLLNSRIKCENLHKVFINGDWLGCVKDFKMFLDKYRNMRRTGQLHYLTTISHNIKCNEIHIWCDSGRLVRPLLIVSNNVNDKDYTHDKFKQWVSITQPVIDKLRKGEIGVDDLVKMQIIEFITPEEHANLYCAYELDHFLKYKNDPLERFTHVDIPQGIIGLVALTSVFANHNPAARVCFQSNQVKQTNSWVLKNWAFSAHKDLYFLCYNENPIVSTFAYKHIPPMGVNAMVAIAIYGGYNQEDSLIINKSSVDRGMFDSVHMTFQKTDCEQNETICRPDPAITSDIQSYVNYDKLVNGIVPEGIYVQAGDCLVGKIAGLSKSEITSPNMIYTDRSMIYKEKNPAMVWKVIHSYNNEEKVFVKIIFKTFRKTELGNKFSSRAGQKGITGFLYDDADMPSTASGIKPDMIFNPLSLITRMTTGVIFEGMLAKLSAHLGVTPDATMFKKIDTDNISQQLKKYGFNSNGTERLYNGMTGQYMDAEIFMCPIYYQTLQKYTCDTVYANNISPTDVLTRQPLHGKRIGGGARMGSMETACLSVASINFLHEKMTKHSDGMDIYVCTQCNQRAFINTEQGIYKCNYCGDMAVIEKVKSTHTSNLFMNELQAMSIGMKLKTRQPAYEALE